MCIRDSILGGTLMPELSRKILEGLVDGTSFNKITVDVDGDGFTYQAE